MSKVHLNLQASEAVVVQAAATIYGAMIMREGYSAEQEQERIDLAIRAAGRIAVRTDVLIRSDDEVA